MPLSTAYLTPNQLRIWSLRREDLSQADIARRLGITPQTVNKTLGTIDSKVSQALLELAQANRIQIRTVDPEKGFLLGRSLPLGMDTLITFSPANGVQVWHRREQGCDNCDEAENCRRILLSEASYRGIELPADKDSLRPSELAESLFSRMLGEEKP